VVSIKTMTLANRGRRKASAVMDDLLKDPDYIAKLAGIKKEQRENIREFNEAAKPLLEALATAGFPHVEELRRWREYRGAVPILVEWLPKINNYRVKESIVRALTVKWAKPSATPVLISEFRDAEETADSYKWAIGNALETIDDRGAAGELIELLRDKRHGSTRQMLAIALGRTGDLRAFDVLIDLLDDEGVVGHAVVGLGKLADPRARPRLESFISHQKAWIRRAAKQALSRIDKRQQKLASQRGAPRFTM
jgi:HEAT repeat protein